MTHIIWTLRPAHPSTHNFTLVISTTEQSVVRAPEVCNAEKLHRSPYKQIQQFPDFRSYIDRTSLFPRTYHIHQVLRLYCIDCTLTVTFIREISTACCCIFRDEFACELAPRSPNWGGGAVAVIEPAVKTLHLYTFNNAVKNRIAKGEGANVSAGGGRSVRGSAETAEKRCKINKKTEPRTTQDLSL